MRVPHWTPDTGKVPLVADMSSDVLSRPIDVAKYGLVYAGAQKNIGPSGLTIVVVRDDLLGSRAAHHALGRSTTRSQADGRLDVQHSAHLRDLHRGPGVEARQAARRHGRGGREHNRAKAKVLYDFLDESRFFSNPVAQGRPLADERALLARRTRHSTSAFLKGAQERGMLQLKGHRSVGGMRASIYNAMPIEGVQALVAYMKEFERQHG